MTDINPQYVDVDFRREAPKGKVLGCRFETAEMMAAKAPDIPSFADDNYIVPDNLWRTTAQAMHEELSDAIQDVHDQDGIGQCVADAVTKAIEISMYGALGLSDYVRLSASHLYCRVGRGPNSGAFISEGVQEANTRGVVPLDGEEGFDYTYKAVGWTRSLPGGWEKTGLLFTARFARVEGKAAIYSAQWQGKGVVVGRNGHAICYFDPQPDDDGNDYCQSWGNWGSRLNSRIPYGRGHDTGRTMPNVGYTCEEITIRSMVDLP